jgi:ABC-2 type transport system permease protein
VLRNVLLKSLRDVRRGFAWWSVGLVGLVSLIVAVWPTVRDNPALIKLHETYPEELKAFVSFGGEFDFGTPAGYLGAELFSFMVPLLLLVAAIGAGAGAVAGEEERGTLDLLLAHPISRVRLALEKLAALVVEVTGLAAVLFVCLVAGSAAAGMKIAASNLAAATAGALFLALAYGGIAFALGAATGRRALAIGLSAAAAVAAYLVNGLAPLVDALEPAQKASPFYHYAAGDPLRHGLEAGHVLLLVAIAVAAAAVAVFAFDRRNIAVSA